MVQFLGIEYWKKCQEVANVDEEFGIKTRMFNATFTYRVTDKDDLPDIYVEFVDGKITEVRELGEDGLHSRGPVQRMDPGQQG